MSLINAWQLAPSTLNVGVAESPRLSMGSGPRSAEGHCCKKKHHRKVVESSGRALFGIFSPHEFGTDGHRHQQKLLPYNSFSRMHAHYQIGE